ncbi:fumarate reductase (quinol) flavoprotein subunit [Endozoicomonas sp. SCSIO W0465]|uniref:fumarate reductase (quinol) flavoprotein subunit n=1 Tax=Endozoicomonas sp. SCSIO W0465 TaxID=2918516 RepID=UPI0020752EF5|nr:fumarate reductase (quinol) flavoprotein subunit [Endozoicomonas sp. SCSIO W0465]USE35265.1 fumarate reductase (quinol) flavoprotein subunit [Endozoicomonas sp. SCSIO W0465]
MQVIKADVAIVGAGGAGLRAAIAVAEKNPELKVALISKVYPMRSHTVAAEGGSAGVIQDHDSLENHFVDTVAGGDWLCDQDVVDYFVSHATEEMIRLEHWGCPWNRKDDGNVNVRAFGGMKIERTWFAADKSGFHMLHTLFQTSTKHPSIERFDEYFATDLIMEDGRAQGVVAIEVKTGEPKVFLAKSVVLATGGSGRIFRFNTNGAIVTGDGHAMALRAGAPLRDMEFVQYHPTGLPGSGVLMTEGCRGEGGILLNKDGYRYLQDYGLGPETPVGQPKNKYMELGPRDKLSQAFWQEQRKGRTIETPLGDAVHLDLRHLGEQKLMERLPLICSLAKNYLGVDPVHQPIPVRPAVHYTMGGVRADINCATDLAGLFAAGECASVGMHGANRLGSNSLAETVVFGKVAGESAADFASQNIMSDERKLLDQAKAHLAAIESLRNANGTEKASHLRHEMVKTMEDSFGIYRVGEEMQAGLDKISELRERFKNVKVEDKSKVFNTELLQAFELQSSLMVAECMAIGGVERKESRGAHQRIDGFEARDDVNFLKHSVTFYNGDAKPRLEYEDVNVTRFQPEERVYGAAAEKNAAEKNGEGK